MKEIINNNYTFKIGNNKKENWLILEYASKDDIIFHLSHYPSCYVILSNYIDLNEDIIKEGCFLCKNNTKYKNLKNLKIDYTSVSNVVKGEQEGEIIYLSNRKIKNIII